MEQERPTTTFHQDFAIAERFGESAVIDTFKRAFEEWKDDYRMFTELSIVLNHRLWGHCGKGNMDYARLYDSLWKRADYYAVNNYEGEAAEWYYRVTD